jgi:hypothetical protein
LVTCVIVEGGLGVFPNTTGSTDEAACTSIGASLPVEGAYGGLSSSQVRALRPKLEDAFKRLVTTPDCAPPEELQQALRDVLDTFEARDWVIKDATTRFAAERDCAMFSIDPGHATLLLIDGR